MMKRALLILAFLSALSLAGCGVGDAGRWLVTTSLRAAYGCSLLVSSDQAAVTAADRERRPQPLLVADPSIVRSTPGANPSVERIAAVDAPLADSRVEIAELPISRDLSSIDGAGTRRSYAFVHVAQAPRAAGVRVYVARPELPHFPSDVSVCPGTKG
jgi:hypothetical protein